MTYAAFNPIRQATCLVLASALATLSTPSWSSETTATLALKALLGPQAAFQQQGGLSPVAMPAAAAAAAGSGTASAGMSAQASAASGTVTVQRGETLDRLIRRALPDAPLHPDFLRKAFISLNPQAFPSGSPHQMRTGTTLQVPSMATLRQMLLTQHPTAAALLQSSDSQTAERAANAQDSKDQRNWVRFP
jgi:Tfp pilus assembly protein FimV